MMSHRYVASIAASVLSLGFAAFPAEAQVAGSTTIGVSVTEQTDVAMGWSVKKTLLGKAVFTDKGERIGNVEDLIISPKRSLSYLIVGAGGFVGIGRHDVAIPVSQIQDQAGKLVMPGVSKDILRSLPEFEYASDTLARDSFLASADRDISNAQQRLSDLVKSQSGAKAETVAKIDRQITDLKRSSKIAENKLAKMRSAGANRWRDFEADVGAAMARLRNT